MVVYWLGCLPFQIASLVRRAVAPSDDGQHRLDDNFLGGPTLNISAFHIAFTCVRVEGFRFLYIEKIALLQTHKCWILGHSVSTVMMYIASHPIIILGLRDS